MNGEHCLKLVEHNTARRTMVATWWALAIAVAGIILTTSLTIWDHSITESKSEQEHKTENYTPVMLPAKKLQRPGHPDTSYYIQITTADTLESEISKPTLSPKK